MIKEKHIKWCKNCKYHKNPCNYPDECPIGNFDNTGFRI